MNTRLVSSAVAADSTRLTTRRSADDRGTIGRVNSHSGCFGGRRRRIRGYTLIESLVSIAVIGVVLTVTTLALHAMRRADRRLRDDLNHQREFDRLAIQLRCDAHLALTVTTVDDEDGSASRTLELTLPGSPVVRYTLVADGVERTLRRGESPEHREVFRLPSLSDARWRVDMERSIRMVSLIVEPQLMSELGGPMLPYEYRIDAAVMHMSPQPKSPEV